MMNTDGEERFPRIEVPSHRAALRGSIASLNTRKEVAKRFSSPIFKYAVPATLLVALALSLFFVFAHDGNHRIATTPKMSDSVVRGVLPNPNATPEDYGYKTYTSVADAERALGFKVNTPKAFTNATIASVVVGDNEMGEHGLAVKYTNGAIFSCYKSNSPVDYAGQIKSMQDLSTASSVKPTALPYPVSIAGYQGMLWPPHMNAGDTKPGPAAVYWSDNNFNYQLIGASSDSSPKQVKAVAESVY